MNPSGMSDAKRALLDRFLRTDASLSCLDSDVIPARPSDSPALPSHGQEQQWIHAQMVADPTIYNEPVTLRRTGPLDLSALQNSLNEIIRRHEAWRTNFAIRDGQLVQVINPPFELDLPFVDLRRLPKTEREAEALRLATEDARRPFDLAEGPLLRALLIQLDDEGHRVYITLHQIIFDGVSLYSVFLPELTALYDAFANGRKSPLSDLPIQYADFAHWQRLQAQTEGVANELEYWRKQLSGAPAALEFPTDRPRPTVQTFKGRQVSFELTQELSDRLKTLSRNEGTTLFMTLLAAFEVVLNRYTNETDLVLGTVTTTRKRSELESMLGFFLNTMVLRADVSGDPTFRDLLQRVKNVTVEALAHGDVPIHRLLKELEYERDPSRNPLFQVMFVLEPPLPAPQRGWDLTQVDVDAGIARVDLYLELDDRPEGLVGRVRFNTDLFDDESITRLIEHLRTLLEAVVIDPERCISSYQLINPCKSPELIRPTIPFTPFAKQEIEQSITARFEAQVSKYPKRIAVKTSKHEWSYDELNLRANRIAQELLARRSDSEERVAILLEHDAPMIAALLGALKAGKTYVPLDPSSPVERLATIIEDAQTRVLLSNDQNLVTACQLLTNGVELINIDQLRSRAATAKTAAVSPDRLAYILYTSGSTGRPKGVMQNHRNVLHYIRVYTNNLHLNCEDRLTLLSSYCFDASVMDIYGALLNGATLYPIDLKQVGIAGLAQCLRDEEISVYHSTPTVYRYFVNSLDEQSNLPDLRLIVLGGEKVSRNDIDLYQQHFSDDCLFVNGFGPTEATVVLQNFIDQRTKLKSEHVPLGLPVEDTEVVLLNKEGKPSDIAGEIAIKSAHLALGYWRNPEATANAFVDLPSKRLYRTGDMARCLSDGSLVFAGRKDHQVKIRGFRVELGEIESALAEHPGVRECAVVTKDGAGRDHQLVAYFVSRASINCDDLRAFLKQKLPDYMIPAWFVALDALPLTASGKLNRLALPEPNDLNCRSDATFVGPRNELERALARIWADVLEAKTISINHDFFDLGGHSLLAVRLFAEMERQLGKRLPLITLFQAPTIARLAAVLEGDSVRASSSLVPIQPTGSKPPFFCVHAVGGTVIEYHELARRLGLDQPFYGLQSAGLDEEHQPHTRIEDMATHYIKELRAVQPNGPYFIGGRSLGGMIAYEIACQLKEQSEQVALLAVLDSYPVGYRRLAGETTGLSSSASQSLRRMRAHASNLRGLSFKEKLLYLLNKSQYGPIKIKSQIWRVIYRSYDKLGRNLPGTLRNVQEFNWLAAHAYTPRLYSGKVTLFWASTDRRASYDLIEGWQLLARGGVDVHEVPGTHLDMIKEPHVAALAEQLAECIAQAQATPTEYRATRRHDRIMKPAKMKAA